MTDFEKRIPEDGAMIEEWPDPFESDEEEDYEEEPEGPKDYEVRFKVRGLSDKEVDWLSRFLFEMASSVLDIPYEKFDELEIEED